MNEEGVIIATISLILYKVLERLELNVKQLEELYLNWDELDDNTKRQMIYDILFRERHTKEAMKELMELRW